MTRWYSQKFLPGVIRIEQRTGGIQSVLHTFALREHFLVAFVIFISGQARATILVRPKDTPDEAKSIP